MNTIGYEKAYEVDVSAGTVNIRELQENNNFVAMGILIASGSNDTEDIVGTLMGNGTNETFNLRVGIVHTLRFSSIASQGDGTTSERILIIGV